jgi:hypothetical protein
MQPLAPPTGDHNPNGATAADVLDALTGQTGGRRFSFRYELLSSANVLLGDLDNVLDATIEMDWLADIKRKARFTVRDDGVIDYLSDRIKPWARLHLPPYGDDDFVEWPLGVFLLSTPSRSSDASDAVIRQVDGYDGLQVFIDDLVTDRYTVAAGTAYTAAVSTLLGSIAKNVAASSSTLPVAKEWDPGTSKLKIINELLGAINYQSLSFDEDGVAIVRAYTAPSVRASEYTYADNSRSVMLPEVEQTFDLFSVPNRWVLVVSDPDRAALSSTYTNTDPSSPTSTVRRQRTIVDFRTEQDAADQTALDAKAARLAFEASQVFEAIDFETGLMPIHSGNDVYAITYSTLAVNAKYSEQSWSMPLKAGATMRHRARRVVTV